MSSITAAPTTAVASPADTYLAFDLGDITSPKDLIQAFRIFKLNGSGIGDIKEAPQHSQTPQLAGLLAPTHTQAPINNKTFKLDLERLADDISAMDISRPARRSAKRLTTQAHPYKRLALTKTEKILSSHGMVNKGAPVVQVMFSPGQIKSVASKPCIKMNNATLSLLSNASSPADMFDSPFNWSTAWLSRGCATSTPALPIKTEVYVSPATNAYSENSPMEEIVVSVPAIVKRGPSKDTGKIKKSRLPKSTPYSKEKTGRKKKVIREEPVISKFDAEVASLAEMLSHCRLNNASTSNARLTRSRARAARKAEACHDSGYEGGHDD